MGIKDRSRISDDGTVKFEGGLPAPGEYKLRFGEGICKNVNDVTGRISIMIPIRVVDGQGGWNEFLGIEQDFNEARLCTFIDVAGIADEFDAKLLQMKANPDNLFDPAYLDKVVHLLVLMLTDKTFEGIIDHKVSTKGGNTYTNAVFREMRRWGVPSTGTSVPAQSSAVTPDFV